MYKGATQQKLNNRPEARLIKNPTFGFTRCAILIPQGLPDHRKGMLRCPILVHFFPGNITLLRQEKRYREATGEIILCACPKQVDIPPQELLFFPKQTGFVQIFYLLSFPISVVLPFNRVKMKSPGGVAHPARMRIEKIAMPPPYVRETVAQPKKTNMIEKGTEETKTLDALSFAMYGRGLQNRCSLLNVQQREQLTAVASDMRNQNRLQQTSENEAVQPVTKTN